MAAFFPLIVLIFYAVGIFLGSIIAGVGFRLGWEWAGRRFGSPPS